MRKTFLLDTNVLVNDPLAFKKFPGHDVIIPLIVIVELDGLKKKRDASGTNARIAARAIDDLEGDLHEGIFLADSDSHIRVTRHVANSAIDVPNNKNMENDHIILQHCIEEGAILVTEDINCRITAKGMGIQVERYMNAVVHGAESMFDESRMVPVTSEVISTLYDKTKGSCYVDMDAHENEYLTVFDEFNPKSSALVRVVKNNGRVLLMLVDSKRTALQKVRARNKEQAFLLDAIFDPGITLVVATGHAGCGKTLCAIAGALEQVTDTQDYKRLVVSRPVIPMGKDIGYLPGTMEEKMDPWMGPIHDSVEFLTGKGSKAMEFYKDKDLIKIEPMTYIRGRSFPDQVIVVDEAQQLSAHEMKTLVTRIGSGSKLILTGDPYQIDSPYLDQYNNGLSHVINAFRGQECFAHINLTKGERSKLAELAAELL